jgi:SpoVK/Ycf46/Vps4 family AAA+-type ATPase
MGTLATRLDHGPTWDDLVLPRQQLTVLESIAAFVRHRQQVMVEWGFGRRLGAATGLTALFAGESGTGKTLAARVIAADLGLEAYRIDLSGVVSKYIGETEKNLDLIFAAADGCNAVLIFDEADALFGRRTAVSDARDRYANLEVAYLLQRLESYDGAVILTTNLRHNIDPAFLRRLDFTVDFPLPGLDERVSLWARHLPPEAPTRDLELTRLGEVQQIAGGSIASCVRLAAFAAAADGGCITMEHLEQAIDLELRKLGRLGVDRHT